MTREAATAEPFRDAADWNAFVALAKNGHFLFHRDYMEYHADRFMDASLVLTWNGGLAGVIPASTQERTIVSHGGLTFGGLVVGAKTRLTTTLALFETALEYWRAAGAARLVYKPVPHIYHRVPAEDDLYALFRHGARLIRRDVSTTIDYRERIRPSKGRQWGVKQARRYGVEVRPSQDWEAFMAIETELLGAKYGATPVHTAAELRLLAERFPENIELFGGYIGDRLLAGVCVYVTPLVAHAQYIAATDEGKAASALDLVLHHVLEERYVDRRYFDFGISTEDAGRFLNASLLENKESHGGRSVVYDWYEVDL